MNYNKIFNSLEKAITNPNLYWQSLSVIICFLFAYFFYILLRKFFFPKILFRALKQNPEINRIIIRYCIPLSYSFISIILLSTCISMYKQFSKDVDLLLITIKFLLLFSFLRFVRIFFGNSFFTNILGLFLISVLLFDIFSILDPVISYLENYGLKIGKSKISIYLILKSFFVIIILSWLSSFISKKSKSYIDNSNNINTSTKGLVGKIIDIVIYTIFFIVVLRTLGFDMTTFAVVGGAIGVGIGFGLQKIASNFISGMILIFEKSVEIGDIIELENGAIYGTIKKFGGRHIVVDTLDGREIMIPNEEFVTGKVTNWSYSNNRARLEVKVGVDYSSDLELVQKILLECATQDSTIATYPPPECHIVEFGDYDIKFVLHFWINDITEGRMKPRTDMFIAIKNKFALHKISIPYPQYNLHIANKDIDLMLKNPEKKN